MRAEVLPVEPLHSTTANNTGLQARALALADAATLPVWLADYRARARRHLSSIQFPERKSESWKYTSLAEFAQSPALASAATHSDATIPADALPPIDAWRVVLVNGRPDLAQSRLPDDDSIRVLALSAVPSEQQSRVRELLALAADARLPFTAFNSAAFADGIYVQVRKGTRASKPLHLVCHAAGNVPASSQVRLLVDIEAQAALTLVEQFTGVAPGHFTNAVTTIELARDAQLTHVRLQLEDHRQSFVGALTLRQHAGSHCDAFVLMTGGRLKRNDVSVEMAGQGAEINLKGAYLVGSDEHADNQVTLEHASPGARSEQQYKGIVGGNGRAVFNGRIHIHPGAKQTSAELVNNNLLLSRDAEVDTKPELEIYNDDVKCSHGATVGQLNDAGVFYLQSRGIGKADAELMLSLGFVNALVDQLPLEGLAVWVRAAFARWFAERSGRGATP